MSNKPKESTKEHLYDVFMCHNGCDKNEVEAIAKRLQDEANLRPFLDKWNLVPGEPWQEELEKALDASSTCAVFIGADGLGPWENEEMRAALNERAKNMSLRVIPVLLPISKRFKHATIPHFLERFTRVDFREGILSSDAFNRLVAGILGEAPGRGDVSRSASRKHESEAVQWVIVVKGTVNDIDEVLIDQITNQLRRISGDASLTIRKVKRGSVVLVIESSNEGFKRVMSLFESGKLQAIEGMSILGLNAYEQAERITSVWDPVLKEIVSFGKVGQDDLAKLDPDDLEIVIAESRTQNEDEDLLLTPRIFVEWPNQILIEFVKWAYRHQSVRTGSMALSYLAEHILRSYEISRKLPTKKMGSGRSGGD